MQCLRVLASEADEGLGDSLKVHPGTFSDWWKTEEDLLLYTYGGDALMG